jgi:hypothetical protein
MRLIRRTLNECWDPIPGSPDDEYEDYASRIRSMVINHNADAADIAAYLLSVERDMMGYDGNEEACLFVADEIVTK